MRPSTTPAKGWLLRNLPNDPARIPGSEHAVRDVPRDHAPGPDNRLRADLHAGADDRPAADPHIGTDLDGLAVLLLGARVAVQGGGGGVVWEGGAKRREASDPPRQPVEDDTVKVEDPPPAQQVVGAVVTEERRLHPDRLPAPAQECREDAA